MLMTYGRGRAEQFRLHPTFGSALNFVPPLFCLYLLVSEWFLRCPAFCARRAISAGLPLIVYGLMRPVISMLQGMAQSGITLPLLVASHIFYGLGFSRALFTKLNQGENKPRFEVKLETIAG